MEDIDKRKVILVTDGDTVARKAVEIAAQNIGGRCISNSAGNPTHLSGKEIIKLIKQAKNDPVVVMADDRGHTGEGKGEQVIREISNDPEIDVIGVVAVASNTSDVIGVKVDFSVSKDGAITKNTVDKCGNTKNTKIIHGDTVDVLNNIQHNLIAGIGDPGKMDGKDNCEIGAPIITKAMEEILKRSGNK